MEGAPKQALSITQAFNYLKSIKDKIMAKVKAEIKSNAQISIAPPADRQKFLEYGISLMEKVESEEEDMFYKVTGKSKNLYSNKELTRLFQSILTLRVRKYSINQIAFVLKTPPEILEKVETIAMTACAKSVERVQAGAVPILGGVS